MAITGSPGPALVAEPHPAAAGHRERLLAGLAAALRERPYGDITVADVVRHARTSRRTFYEQFADKQDCLIALLQEETDQTVARIADDNNFTSREPAKTPKAPKRKPRIHRTGRNQQFTAKATAETVSKIYQLADARKVPLGELLRLAVEALERDDAVKQANPASE